jgi:fucose 4-O-acetylase-like acetyltransferase
VRGSAPDGLGSTVEQWASRRQLYLDNLKVLLIAAIIAGHGVVSYATMVSFAYADVREVTLSPVTEAVALALVAPFGLFMIPLLFLVAGLLTRPSLARKGSGGYVRDRLLRLGVPFAVFSLLVWPALLYAWYRPLGNAPGSYWAELVGTPEESLDIGYLWFVGDLLIFSLVYAGWVKLRGGHPGKSWRGEVTACHLVVLTAVVTLATFLVRLVFPFDSQKYVDLNLYQWPECLALFALGVMASGKGWLTAVPAQTVSQRDPGCGPGIRRLRGHGRRPGCD